MQLNINKISHQNDIFENKNSNRTASSLEVSDRKVYQTSVERKT
jgi:hypothetical protein